MKKMAIDAFVEKWTNDGAFREAYRKDPLAALKTVSFQLDASEIEAIKAIGATLGGSTGLEPRLNRNIGGGGTKDSGGTC